MKENTYLEFNNPIHIIWRKGTADDPYVDRLDISRVVNQRISLLEIPDELYRVRIADMQEINYKRFIKNNLSENEFYVDYSNGFVYFHRSKEAATISLMYKGRGMLLYPSSRIVHYDGTSTSETLHVLIEKTRKQIADLIDETQIYEQVMENMVVATNLTNEATDKALQASHDAKNAVDLVRDAYKTTVLIYMPFVQTEADIATTYPNPMVGWTVFTYDTGIRYRWNGAEWTPIDSFGGNIPLANENIDGLLSKELYVKLNNITDTVDTRVIVFIIPQEVLAGIQDPHIYFPFDGTIEDIKASVSKKGTSNTSIRVEKSSDYMNWTNITTTPLTIKAGEFFDDKNYALLSPVVEEASIFRLYIPMSGDVQNLTVIIKVKL